MPVSHKVRPLPPHRCLSLPHALTRHEVQPVRNHASGNSRRWMPASAKWYRMDRLIFDSTQPPSRPQMVFAFSMMTAFFAGLLLLTVPDLSVFGRPVFLRLRETVQQQFSVEENALSYNVSTCPGYGLRSLQETRNGLTARLNLAGSPCNAYGLDIQDLTLEVNYDSDTRLHVNIYDTARKQFTVPESVLALPAPDNTIHKDSSDLVFNYESSPFAFWITRRSEPDATPLFDTRISSLPETPIPPVLHENATFYDHSSALDGFPLVFEDQYLQLASALPKGANIYGLGEVLATSGFRRDVGETGQGTVQAMWARDVADAIDENVYGAHNIYLEHRYDPTTQRAQTHGVFLYSSAGGDVLLLTPKKSDVSLVEYRMIGGTLDFYFFSGPTPQKVIEQHGELVGYPMWQPAWAFGFHLCKWGYNSVEGTRYAVDKMREADIPMETIWNDIDLYHAYRDFTSDPEGFEPEAMRAFLRELASRNQHYVPIVDAAIPKEVNDTDVYDPYRRGVELDVFIRNPDGTEYVGQVWPGYTVFPDWFAENAQKYWTEALQNWSALGVEFSGIWLDMNEASSFCDGSCGTTADLSNTTVPFILPGLPGNMVTAYPEGYDSSIWGPSGNRTINGRLTYGGGYRGGPEPTEKHGEGWDTSSKRGRDGRSIKERDLNTPPYAIHHGAGRLSDHALATNATHAGGLVEFDTHNLWGFMEERATHIALEAVHPGKRPFLISRSTFPGAGRWTGHWLGDNFSKWSYMYMSIQGVLQFQVFQVPFTGADTCGFNGNTDEELCSRWMQLSAFLPFYRNHNVLGAIPQEPYNWDSVADASRQAIYMRYSLLPYWYTLFANSSQFGSPPIRAVFWEFPDEPELFGIDRQFMLGPDLLVTPVLMPNVSTVGGWFPGRGTVTWRDFYTHDVQQTNPGQNTSVDAPLGKIPVHIREGAAILTHPNPQYTIEETVTTPYGLLVSQAADGYAFGHAYIDDGESIQPTPHRNVGFHVNTGRIEIQSSGTYSVQPRLETITVLGTERPSRAVRVQGSEVYDWEYAEAQQKLVINGLQVDLNVGTTIEWD